MFNVKNLRTGKIVKDAITSKTRVFETAEAAQHMADSLRRDSALNATAWNSTRKSAYIVQPAA